MHGSISLRDGLISESLNGEMVVLDSAAGVVHRLSGPALDVVALVAEGESDVPAEYSDTVDHLLELGIVVARGMSRRTVLRAGTAAAAVGIVTLVLPSAAAASSGGGGDGVNTFSDSQVSGTGSFTPPTLYLDSYDENSANFSFYSAESGATFKLLYRDAVSALYSVAYTGTDTVHTQTGLVPGNTYTFLLQATVSGLTQYSSVQSVTPGAPGSPYNLTISRRAGSATVSWMQGSGPTPVSYTVSYRDQSGPAGAWTNTTTTDTTLTISGLTAGTTYDVKVVANGSAVSSGPLTGEFTCPSTADLPGAVENLRATAVYDTVAEVRWNQPTTGNINVSYNYAAKYRLTSAPDVPSSYVVPTVPGSYTYIGSYPNDHLTPGTSYTVKVWAENQYGEGPVSTLVVTTAS